MLYTDAMWETGARRGAIGIVIFDPEDKEHKWRHAAADVPEWVVASFRPREQYITQLERVRSRHSIRQ